MMCQRADSAVAAVDSMLSRNYEDAQLAAPYVGSAVAMGIPPSSAAHASRRVPASPRYSPAAVEMPAPSYVTPPIPSAPHFGPGFHYSDADISALLSTLHTAGGPAVGILPRASFRSDMEHLQHTIDVLQEERKAREDAVNAAKAVLAEVLSSHPKRSDRR